MFQQSCNSYTPNVCKVSTNLIWFTLYRDEKNHADTHSLRLFSKISLSFTKGSSVKNKAKADKSGAGSVVEHKETAHKGYVEDIRVTLPSGMVGGEGKN